MTNKRGGSKMANYLNPSDRPDTDLRRVDREGRVPDEDLREQEMDEEGSERGLLDRVRGAREQAKKERQKREALKTVKQKSAALKRRSRLSKLGLGSVADRVSDASASGNALDDVGTTETVADRAERASRARAPVNATLNPMGDPRAIESFATAGDTPDNPDDWLTSSGPPADGGPAPLFSYGGGMAAGTDGADDSERVGWFDDGGAEGDEDDDPLAFEEGWF